MGISVGRISEVSSIGVGEDLSSWPTRIPTGSAFLDRRGVFLAGAAKESSGEFRVVSLG